MQKHKFELSLEIHTEDGVTKAAALSRVYPYEDTLTKDRFMTMAGSVWQFYEKHATEGDQRAEA